MKKKLIILLLAVFICSIFALCACDFLRQYSVTFTLSEDGSYYILSEYNSGHANPPTEYTIPDEYKGLPVKEIGDGAFQTHSLEKIVMSNNIVKIGRYAFNYKNEIILSSNLEEIGEGAFNRSGISKDAELVLPDSLKIIGDSAFDMCDFTAVKLPDGLESIGEYAFSGTSLESVTVPSTVVSIGDRAFSSCNSLKTATVLANVEVLPSELFSGCDQLKDVILSNSIKAIGDSAFSECHCLENIQLPANLVEIGEYAFYKCIGLKEIIIPATVNKIGDDAFAENNRSIILCKGDAEAIPGNKWFTAYSPVVSCFDSYGQADADYEYVITEKNGVKSVTIIAYNGDDTNVVIPSTFETYPVTAISNGVFWERKDITAVTIPENVEYLGKRAFSITGITSISIPSSVKKIDDECFLGCYDLSNISLGEKLEYIGSLTFVGCKLSGQTVRIPKTVQYIGYSAFSDYSFIYPSFFKSTYREPLEIYCDLSSKPNDWDNEWYVRSLKLVVYWEQ